MVLDSSAIVAIHLREPGHERLLDVIEPSGRRSRPARSFRASPVMVAIGRLHIWGKLQHFCAYLALSFLPVIGFRDRRVEF